MLRCVLVHCLALQEYLLVYNYQAYGADTAPPDTGIVVLHVDESVTADEVNSVRGYPSQTCWPWNGKHYSVAVLAADGEYKLETVSSGGGGRDADSCYEASQVSTISDSTVPSTNQYHYGYGVKKSGISVTVNSDSADCMSVRVLGDPSFGRARVVPLVLSDSAQRGWACCCMIACTCACRWWWC